MEAGDSMLYPMQAVDGLTHLHAGPALGAALLATKTNGGGQRCAVGHTVVTLSFGLKSFDIIAHTPTPFWHAAEEKLKHDRWRRELINCYLSSAFAIASAAPIGVECAAVSNFPDSSHAGRVIYIATPLLGAGAGGAPLEAAAACAAEAMSMLRSRALKQQLTFRFVLKTRDAWQQMRDALKQLNVTVPVSC